MHDGPQAGRLLFILFDKDINDNGYGCNENFNECIHNLGFKRLIKFGKGKAGRCPAFRVQSYNENRVFTISGVRQAHIV